MLGNSLVAAQVVASEEGLSSVELNYAQEIRTSLFFALGLSAINSV